METNFEETFYEIGRENIEKKKMKWRFFFSLSRRNINEMPAFHLHPHQHKPRYTNTHTHTKEQRGKEGKRASRREKKIKEIFHVI
jgi:hypothetical protein